MTARSFHLGDLLSITDGHLVSPDHIGGVYKLVDFVTGQAHMTHQLPRAADVVKPWLLRQHPWLAEIVVPDRLDSEEKVLSWLVRATDRWGAMHEVEAMPFGAYLGRDPLAELEEMLPEDAIVLKVEYDPLDDGGLS